MTSKGPIAQGGSSAARLLVPTVADRLRAARPDARVISVSLKDRAALLSAGQRPTHAIWFDKGTGSFVTSTAVEPALPAWASALGDARAVEEAKRSPWEPLDAGWLARNAGRDDAPGEGDLDGLGTVFPHVIRSNAAFRATPASDAMILDLALAGALAEHDPKAPMLVLVSLSAADVIGHTFGPSSWEAWDQLRRLDGALGRFLSALEAGVGPASVVLSADHGNIAMPESQAGVVRIAGEAIVAELRSAAAERLGPGRWIDGLSDGYVFLGSDALALPPERRAVLDDAVHRVLSDAHRGELAAVYDVRELAQRCPGVLAGARGIPERARSGEGLEPLVCRSFRDGAGAGDYYLVPRAGAFFEGDIGGRGGGHGTPYLYDRTVPLFVRAASDGRGAGTSIAEPVDFSAYSALEASLLGIDARSPTEILAALRAR